MQAAASSNIGSEQHSGTKNETLKKGVNETIRWKAGTYKAINIAVSTILALKEMSSRSTRAVEFRTASEM